MWNASSLTSLNLFLCFFIGIVTLLLCMLRSKADAARISAGVFFLLLFLFMGLRSSNVGTDALNYANMYFSISQTSLTQILAIPLERGFFVWCYLLGFISSYYPVLFIASGLVFCLVLIAFLYKENQNYLGVALFVFVALNGFGIYLSALRQSLAFSLLILSVPFVVQKRWVIFTLLVLLAGLFHTSAYIFFLIVPLSFVPFTKKIGFLLIFLILLSLPFRHVILDFATSLLPQYQHYTDYLSSSYLGQIQGFNLGYLLVILLKAMVVAAPWAMGFLKEIQKSRHLTVLVWLSVLSLGFMALSLETRIFNRLEMYFFLFACVLYAKALAWLRENRLNQKFLFYLLAVTGPLLMYRVFLFWKEPIWDYFFFWQ